MPLRLIHTLSLDEVNKALRDIQDMLTPGPGGLAVSALGGQALTLGTGFAVIPGVSVRLTRSGNWLVAVSANVTLAGDASVDVGLKTGQVAALPDFARTTIAGGTHLARTWIVSANLGDTLSAIARKTGGGTSAAGANARLDAVWISA